jgi:hypothetical protein
VDRRIHDFGVPPPASGTLATSTPRITAQAWTRAHDVFGLLGACAVELVRLYSNPDVRDIVAHAAKAVTHVKLDHYSAASPLSTRRRWRLVDRLGEQIIRELLTDSRAGTPQRELAERYGISVISVKRILRH